MENGLGYSTEEDQQVSSYNVFLEVMYMPILQTLERILSDVDKTLFEDYVEQKASAANKIMQGGILNPNINWFETPPPTGNFACMTS